MKITYNDDIHALEQKLETENIHCLNVGIPPHIGNENSICFTSYNEFLTFLKNENIKSVFCARLAITKEYYYITDDVLEDVMDSYEAQNCPDAILKAVVKYNLDIESNENQFSNLQHNFYFVAYNGFVVYIILSDQIDLLDPHEQLETILESKKIEIDSEREQHRILIETLQEKLKQEILDDSNFYKCTNISLRRDYTAKLWKKLSKKYEPLKLYWHLSPNLLSFVNNIWIEYRNSKK
jgi:hypothetical protein